MVMSNIHRRSGSSMRRQVVRDFSPRVVDPSSTTSATAGLVGREDSSDVSNPLPTSVKALAAVMVIFGLIIIGIAAWRIGRCRRQKLRARMAASQRMSRYVAEKPANAIQVNFDTMIGDEKNSYFPLPALLSRPEPAHAPNKAIKKGTNRFIGSLNMVSSQLGGKNRSSNHLSSPPPPVPAKEVVPSMPIPEITIYRKTSTRSNKSGRVDLRVDVNASALTGQALALQLLTANTANTATQVPSPRSSSQLDSPLKNIPLTARPKSAKTPGGKKLPRLMLVTATFIPSLPDELLIRVGETLRMIEEYEDEWCLAQRVGKSDAEKGVIPRFCLQERAEILGRPSHKRGRSSVSSAFNTPYTPATALQT